MEAQWKRAEVMNRRGHARRILFDRLEGHFFGDDTRILFRHVMNRDYSVPCYWMPSASSNVKLWAKGYGMIPGASRETYSRLQEEGLIVLTRYSASITRGESRVEFHLNALGVEFIVERTIVLNDRLMEICHPSAVAESILLENTENLILGLDRSLMDRYIRTG